MKKRLFFAFWLILPCMANADTWSGFTTITSVYPYADKNVRFITEYSHPTSTCDGGKRFRLDSSLSGSDIQFSILLAAFMAGKQISFLFDETQTPNCAPRINRFRVIQ